MFDFILRAVKEYYLYLHMQFKQRVSGFDEDKMPRISMIEMIEHDEKTLEAFKLFAKQRVKNLTCKNNDFEDIPRSI